MMIRPLALYIGLRYTRAKRRNHFISFISLASMLGIALGVMVLITVLSVMNGFDYQIRTRFFAIAPQVTVFGNQAIQKVWPDLDKKVMSISGVEATAPYVSGKGMLSVAGQFDGIQVVGIDPKVEPTVSEIGKKIVQGSLNTLTPNSFNMIMGKKLAETLGLQVGDKVTLLTPRTTVSLAGVFPVYRRFTLSGIFEAGSGFGFENTVAYINLQDASKLFPPGIGSSGLHVKLNNLYDANSISQAIENFLPPGYLVTNWTEQFGAFFQALTMEKTMLFLILLLIVAVAAFNLVSTLVMVVNDKRADIAILRTLGASPRTIMATFIIQGAVVGLIGTLLGVIGGIIFSLNVTHLANFLQREFNVQFISSSVYFIDFLPSRLQAIDVVRVGIAAFLLSLLATIYPAFIAFRTQPAEALRYE